jgi:hypothetical protein
MTDIEINVAIAEACPSVFVRKAGQAGWNYKSSVHGRILPCINGNIFDDLNAMHEAEETLRNNQFHYVDYSRQLFRVISGTDLDKDGLGYFGFSFISAPARQRAEAFLKTIGKWKETQ